MINAVAILDIIFIANVKEHAPLSAGASVDHGVEVVITREHRNRTACRGCHDASCCALGFNSRCHLDFHSYWPTAHSRTCIPSHPARLAFEQDSVFRSRHVVNVVMQKAGLAPWALGEADNGTAGKKGRQSTGSHAHGTAHDENTPVSHTGSDEG